MTSTGKNNVLIVGAGPSGLTAANVLARRGIRPIVLEADSGPTDQSRALIVQARTMELWDKLGLGSYAADHGRKVTKALGYLDGKPLHSGKPLVHLDEVAERATPHPYLLVFEQSKTERMLLDSYREVTGDDVWWKHEVTNVRQSDGVVTVDCVDETGQHTHEADWLLGTDGASSTVRQAIGQTFEGGTYQQRFFLADVAVHWDQPVDDLVLAQSHHGTYLFVPMPTDADEDVRYRILGSLPERLADAGVLDLGDVQNELDQHSGMRAELRDPRWISAYKLHHRIASQFSDRRVLIAGDAAHIHSPVGGQGMNTGIQDAFNAAWKLAMVLLGEADESLLDSYDQERRPVGEALLHGTDEAFSTLVSERPWVRRGVPIAAHLAPHLLEVDRLRGRLFSILSQIAVEYRDSPIISPTEVGTLTAGDRAPHAVMQDGRSVLRLMDRLRHHLLTLTPPTADKQAPPAPTTVLPPGTVEVALRDEPRVLSTYQVEEATRLLVRPDGYIEWIGRAADLGGLYDHVTRVYRARD